jgi:hypothetical protein
VFQTFWTPFPIAGCSDACPIANIWVIACEGSLSTLQSKILIRHIRMDSDNRLKVRPDTLWHICNPNVFKSPFARCTIGSGRRNSGKAPTRPCFLSLVRAGGSIGIACTCNSPIRGRRILAASHTKRHTSLTHRMCARKLLILTSNKSLASELPAF